MKLHGWARSCGAQITKIEGWAENTTSMMWHSYHLIEELGKVDGVSFGTKAIALTLSENAYVIKKSPFIEELLMSKSTPGRSIPNMDTSQRNLDLTGGSDSMSNEPNLKNRLRMNQSGRFLDRKFETGILSGRFIHPFLVSTSALQATTGGSSDLQLTGLPQDATRCELKSAFWKESLTVPAGPGMRLTGS